MYIFPSVPLCAWKMSHFTVSNCPYLLGVKCVSLPCSLPCSLRCLVVFALVVFLAPSCQQKLDDGIRLRRSHCVLRQSMFYGKALVVSPSFITVLRILVSQQFISCHFSRLFVRRGQSPIFRSVHKFQEKAPPIPFF